MSTHWVESHGWGGHGNEWGGGLDFIGRSAFEGLWKTGGWAIHQMVSWVCSIVSGLCLFWWGGGHDDH